MARTTKETFRSDAMRQEAQALRKRRFLVTACKNCQVSNADGESKNYDDERDVCTKGENVFDQE